MAYFLKATKIFWSIIYMSTTGIHWDFWNLKKYFYIVNLWGRNSYSYISYIFHISYEKFLKYVILFTSEFNYITVNKRFQYFKKPKLYLNLHTKLYFVISLILNETKKYVSQIKFYVKYVTSFTWQFRYIHYIQKHL